MPGGRPRSDEKERFLAKVKVVESGCHEWQAGHARGGYGKFRYPTKTVTAHRASWELFIGPIPKGQCVLHRCDNRLCVNPQHLFLGTLADNVKDMDEKQRRKTRAKLTETQVKEVRQMLNDRYSQKEIAKKFNVDQTTISRIKLCITHTFRSI